MLVRNNHVKFRWTNLDGMFKSKGQNLMLRGTGVPKPLITLCYTASAQFPCLCQSQLMMSEPLPPSIKPFGLHKISLVLLLSSSAILNLWGDVCLNQGTREHRRSWISSQTSPSACQTSSSIYSGLWIHVGGCGAAEQMLLTLSNHWDHIWRCTTVQYTILRGWMTTTWRSYSRASCKATVLNSLMILKLSSLII